ncbi:MAG: hypothetical protein AB2A00_04760 [Myxococcota bacterium]
MTEAGVFAPGTPLTKEQPEREAQAAAAIPTPPAREVVEVPEREVGGEEKGRPAPMRAARNLVDDVGHAVMDTPTRVMGYAMQMADWIGGRIARAGRNLPRLPRLPLRR